MSETAAGTETVDVRAIRVSIRQAITPRKTIPNAARIHVLEDRLRGHLGQLLAELGDERGAAPVPAPGGEQADDELETMLREAEGLLKSASPSPATGRRARWKHIEIMGYSIKGLLRMYEEQQATP